MPKKPARNAFYFFMKEIEPQLRREGRVFPNGMADVVVVAHPRWKQLPQKEKERFEEMAKREKNRMRGQAGDHYRADNMGNIIANRKDKYTEYEKRRMAEKKEMVKNWPQGKELKYETFYFINFQYICKTDDGEYLPAEIAALEYSIDKGITKQLHRFIEPGRIPTGYRYTCIQNSEESHKIPVEGFELADANYLGLWIQLKNFVNPNGEKPQYPPLYCLGATNNYETVERCLDWIHSRACIGEPNVFHKVYEIESLLQELYAHIGEQASKTKCIERITSSEWDYEPKTRCPYHEELEVKDCSLGVVNRYAYIISDSICTLYDVELTPSHLPTAHDTGTITVLSPSSMPVCQNQESRLPRTSEYTAKPKQKKTSSQEDYAELRRPKPVAPQYPSAAPPQAWTTSGSNGDYTSMGGVNDAVVRPKMDRGMVAMGRANIPAPELSMNDFPPMTGARGRLLQDVQDLNLEQRSVGRGSIINQSKPISQQPESAKTFGGIGRGMINRPVSQPGAYSSGDDMAPLRQPGQPQPGAYSSEDDMPPLRRPGQPLPLGGNLQQSVPTYPAPVNENYNASSGQGITYPPVGCGKGGILEDLMKDGIQPGISCGRGMAPPDLAEKIRVALR
ncbi:hypothetical protein ACF0H5_014466 [Mactra antiquata]